MTLKEEAVEKTAEGAVKGKKERVVHSARERVEAVLAIWTERRRPAEVCRGLGLKEVVLQQWQDRALRGMLDALEPKGTGTGRGPMLPARLEKQLQRQTAERAGRLTRLSRRLAKIQAGKEEAKTV
jgi:transposase-like protein